jgi:hypothetical protein
MDIGPATPEGSTIVAFLFCDYGRFVVRDQNAGIILCVGITSSELEACRKGESKRIEMLLKSQSVFPFTDLQREGVV